MKNRILWRLFAFYATWLAVVLGTCWINIATGSPWYFTLLWTVIAIPIGFFMAGVWAGGRGFYPD